MRLIGHLDELDGTLVRRSFDQRTRDFCELGGMEYVFTMHAREHAEMLAKAKTLQAHGTPRELAKLLDELITLIGGSK
jgi:hypothetical protein